MKTLKIQEVANQVRGVSYKPDDLHDSLNDSSVILLRANNIDDGKINFDDVVYVDKSKVSKEQYLKRGDILVCASSGSKQLVGKAASVDFETECTFGAFCKVVRPQEEFARYLGKYFQSNTYRSKISAVAIGANINNIRNEHIDTLDLRVYDEAKNEEIVHVISCVQSIIEHRKQEIKKLDELIKARFVEMFGDARENPNGYTTVPFIDIIEYMGDIGSNGANKVVVDHLDMKDEEDYAMMVRFTNFTKNDFTDDVKYVSKEAYDFFKKSQIFGGELIICKIGSAGQNYVMPYLNRPVSLGLNQIMVRIKENILMPYLYQYLHTDYGEFLISGCINGAVTKTITKTELKKIPVMLPPMELQNEFAEFVKQVDKSKVAVQKALDETQILFDSLMQKYFG